MQLPLYGWLCRELTGDDELPELGYFGVGCSKKDIGIKIATKWDADVRAEALDLVRFVIREVRATVLAGGPWEVGSAHPFDPIEQAVLGCGLLLQGTSEGDA